MLKNEIAADGFLGNFHALLLMDDAVMIAASREMCERKMTLCCRTVMITEWLLMKVAGISVSYSVVP